MSETKWTPGPWVPRYDDRVTVPEDNNGALSIAHVYSKGRAQQHANQHLIAAAPDLYETLRRAKDMLHAVAGDLEDGYSLGDIRGKYVMSLLQVRDDAHATLAKARGETTTAQS